MDKSTQQIEFELGITASWGKFSKTRTGQHTDEHAACLPKTVTLYIYGLQNNHPKGWKRLKGTRQHVPCGHLLDVTVYMESPWQLTLGTERCELISTRGDLPWDMEVRTCCDENINMWQQCITVHMDLNVTTHVPAKMTGAFLYSLIYKYFVLG